MTVSASGPPDPHLLVGAYVMDAVTETERITFERHLASCDACRDEVRGLRETTARLAAAAAVQPRPELRDQVMLAAARIRQHAPAAIGEADAQAVDPPGRRAIVRSAAGRRVGWMAGLTAAAAAVCVALAAIFGSAMSTAEHRLDMAQQRSHAMASVLGATDAVMLTAQVRTGGSATVLMSHRARALIFTAADLPRLAGARVYQLWLMGPAGVRSVGVLPAPRHGMTGPMYVAGLQPGDKVGLYVAPAGGARRPTGSAILMLSLS